MAGRIARLGRTGAAREMFEDKLALIHARVEEWRARGRAPGGGGGDVMTGEDNG